jgi:hypothetical protein
MKCNIKGLLFMVRRHLYILDGVKDGDIAVQDILEKMEVDQAGAILDELIENIEIVQNDPSQLDKFLELYCLKKS